jgi:GTP-binding protein YchF
MSLSIGIVGLANVGKSTLFNALLKQNLALSANYPFATIEPNVGVASVPDARLEVLAEIVGTEVIKPATIEFVDIAGLVKGASKGEGLGNKFLAHIRETAAIVHVMRVFADEEIIRETPVDPLGDLEIVRLELQLADLAVLEKQVAPKGSVATVDKKRWGVIEEFKQCLGEGKNISVLLGDESNHDEEVKFKRQVARELSLLTSKEEIFVLNVAEKDLGRMDELEREWAKKLNVLPERIVVVSAKVEAELGCLSLADQKLFLAELGVMESGLSRLAKVAYQVLGLQSFLTAGVKEVRAWTIERGTTAKMGAGVIHTDFIKKFIRAKVMTYNDFVQYEGWKKAAEMGKVRLEGKDYVMRKDDVVEFILEQ